MAECGRAKGQTNQLVELPCPSLARFRRARPYAAAEADHLKSGAPVRGKGVLRKLAFTLRKQGSANFQKSLAYYNKAIQLKPKLAEAYMYRGVLYTQMGRKADAQRTWSSSRR